MGAGLSRDLIADGLLVELKTSATSEPTAPDGPAKTELLNRRRWRTRIELANAIFDYLEIFYNRPRRHSSLGMLSPVKYERLQPQLSIA